MSSATTSVRHAGRCAQPVKCQLRRPWCHVTAAGLVWCGDVAYVRSWSTAGKMKRIRNNPIIAVEASTFRGRPTGGPTFRAGARLLSGDEARRACNLINKKHPVLHGMLVPLAHMLARYETVHLELTPLDEPGASVSRARPARP